MRNHLLPLAIRRGARKIDHTRADCASGRTVTLHISVEPTERGEQLRVSTLNTLAQVLNVLAFVLGGMSILLGALAATAGKPQKALVVLGLFGGMSLAAFGANLIRLPGWARKREKQIGEIAEHALKLLSNR